MSAQHTQGRLMAERIPATFNPKMDGFQLVGLTPAGNDLMTVALCTVNEADEANAHRLVACWNACEGIADPENVVARLRVLNDRAPGIEAEAETFRTQRDELLAVLQELEESSAYWSEYDVPIGIVERIHAAIAKARGAA